MAYCPECGAQVAEIDVFCPFCGIALPSAEAANQDDSFSKTIVAPQPESATPESESNITNSEEIKTIEESAPIIAEDEKSLENTDKSYEELLKQDTAEHWILKTKSVDVPSELFNKDITAEKTLVEEPPLIGLAENQIIEQESEAALTEDETTKTEEFIEISEPVKAETPLADEIETPKTAFEDYDVTEEDINLAEAEIEEPVNEEAIFDKVEEEPESINSQTESSLTSYEESEIKEISSAEEPETTSDEIAFQPAEADFISTMSYPKSSATVKGNISDADVFELDETSAPQAEIADENPIVAKEAIDKPIEELPEVSCPPPKFVSVNIMEKEEPKDENIEQSAHEPTIEDLDLTESEEKESRSNTSPNMGGSDTDGKKRTKLNPLDEGTILNGRYEIVRKIGGGGMGAVYLASDKNLGGVLRAVKEMVQSYIEETQQDKAISDFKRESMLLTSLEHQSIPTIYDYFFDEKEARFYLVMKYISGGDLASRIRSANQGRIDEKDVTEWAIQVADVLDYLHNRQPPIVYRDLKPANIMIDGNSGRVMLIDFGIARWINKEEKGVTAVGTMGYAPPELFSGNVESRSDIYSLGSTMFHLLTGADPQSNPLLIFDFQKHPRPRQINPQLSDQMEKILMQSVEYSAEKRFRSAAAMRQALEEHLANLKANKVTFGVGQVPASVGLSEELVFCGFCGQKIVATDMFCAFCGAKQPLARHVGGHSQSYAPRPLTAQLLIIGTNELETPAYRIEKDENLVGRRDPMSNIFPEVDLSKYDPQTKVSRRHARIWREGTQFLVEDLGSSNGTVILPIVNETVRLLPHQPYTLTNGDKLRLGDTTLHFIIG
jgi:serine/threonine-protein kinase